MVRNKLFLFGTNLLRNSLLWLPLLFSTSIISIVIGYTFALAEVEYIPENYNHPLTYQDCGFNQFGGNTGGINSNSLPPFAVCGDKGTKTHRFVKDSADGPGRSLRLKADFPPPPNGGYFGIFHSLAGLTDTDVTFDGVNRVKAFFPNFTINLDDFFGRHSGEPVVTLDALRFRTKHNSPSNGRYRVKIELIDYFLPTTARAVCDRSSAQVVRVTTNSGAAASVIYYRDSALTAFYWACTTNDAKLLDAALTAQNGVTKVHIRGDVATCPAAPATGLRSAGNCLFVVVNP